MTRPTVRNVPKYARETRPVEKETDQEGGANTHSYTTSSKPQDHG